MNGDYALLAVTLVLATWFVGYLAYWCFVEDGWLDVMTGIFGP
jgi:hypothetical protein